MGNKHHHYKKVPFLTGFGKWTISICSLIALLVVIFARVPVTFRYYLLPVIILSVFVVSFVVISFHSIDCCYDTYKYKKDPYEAETKHWGWITLAVIIIFWCFLFSSMKFRNVQENRELVEIQEVSLDEAANLETIRYSLVDLNTARNLGDRKITEAENSSLYDVDTEYNLIKYNGAYYRISSLDFGNKLKAWKGKSRGVPGYVIVNCETSTAEYVKLPTAMKYTPNGIFFNNLSLHLWLRYPEKVIGKSFFEIDDTGNPWYITSVTTPTGGVWGAQKITSFIITDPVTGNSKEYLQNNLPNWVDHAYPLDYLMDSVSRNYRYINGWLNYSKDGVYKLSYDWRGTESNFAGYNTVIGSDGEIYFNTVKTPDNKSEAAEGFIYASVRTGVVKYFNIQGAEESTAQHNAQGLVQELGYRAVSPLEVNIDGNVVYFMPMVDDANMIRRFAFASYTDPQIVVQADTIDKAVRLYYEKLKLQNNSKSDNEEIYQVGVISSLDRIQEDGNTEVLFTVVGSSNRYLATLKNTYDPVYWQIGDEVEFMPMNQYHGVIIVEVRGSQAN